MWNLCAFLCAKTPVSFVFRAACPSRLCFARADDLEDLPSGLRSEKSLRTLVANAQKYYRGAALIAEKDPCRHADDLNAARAKEAIATCLIPDQSLARAEIQQQVVQRMVEESVLTEHTAQRLLSA